MTEEDGKKKLPEGWLQEVIADAKEEVASWPAWKRGERVVQGHIVVCSNCGHTFDSTGACDVSCWCDPRNYPAAIRARVK